MAKKKQQPSRETIPALFLPHQCQNGRGNQEVFYAVKREGKSCTHVRRVQGNRGPRSTVAGRNLEQKAPVGSHSFLSSCFSYGWFNTALMLEGRSYLPWLTNR